VAEGGPGDVAFYRSGSEELGVIGEVEGCGAKLAGVGDDFNGLSARSDLEKKSRVAAGWELVRSAETARGTKPSAANWIR
jgi:hypothetical protein